MNGIHTLALCILSLASPGGVTREHFSKAPMGAMHRATSLATTFTIAADANGLDVALLTALAFWESGFDSRAVSRNGSFGILQLSPRYHRDVRGYCYLYPHLCGVANIERGAQVLATYKRRCKTDGAALRGYRKGTCAPPTARERKVLRTAAWMRRRIGGGK